MGCMLSAREEHVAGASMIRVLVLLRVDIYYWYCLLMAICLVCYTSEGQNPPIQFPSTT